MNNEPNKDKPDGTIDDLRGAVTDKVDKNLRILQALVKHSAMFVLLFAMVIVAPALVVFAGFVQSDDRFNVVVELLKNYFGVIGTLTGTALGFYFRSSTTGKE